ncbi:MAG: PH domain-containing protein [Bacteroidales bacterium]|nr:PH domain-containing protein [Bacteroidales bacterium]
MNIIHYMNLGIGLFMILVGWLIYRYPKFINPYGGMPPERQALVDIDGLKKALALCAGIAGLLIIVVFALGISHVVSERVAEEAMPIILLAMLIPMLIAMRKYNGYGRDASGKSYFGRPLRASSKIAIILIPLTMLVVLALILVSIKPANISTDEDHISISGFYGRDIPYSEIISVEVLDEMPAMQMRLNGSSAGGVNKGRFLTEDGEKCLLFVNDDVEPYIEIRTADQLFFMNCVTPDATLHLVRKMRERIGDKFLNQ